MQAAQVPVKTVPTMNWVFTSICNVGSKKPNASIKEVTTKSISRCEWIISSLKKKKKIFNLVSIQPKTAIHTKSQELLLNGLCHQYENAQPHRYFEIIPHPPLLSHHVVLTDVCTFGAPN
jgi:hypothetical protein